MIKNILFIDDDEDDVEIFKEIIHEISTYINILSLSNGLEIEEVLTHWLPDIIFIDYNMPFINGIDCLKMIRRNKNFNKIPIIFYSSYFDKVKEAYKNGANYVIIKQARVENIKSSIQTVLNRNWGDEKTFKKFEMIAKDDQNYQPNFFH
jgi:CheY-like chemotaxis protein